MQVCTAVMHYGYRIVEDMIDGLDAYLEEQGMASVQELVGRVVPGFREWSDLDMNYNVMAKIDSELCIGCQLCYIACLDGAHQCIHTHQGPCDAYHGPADHGAGLRSEVKPAVEHALNGGLAHVPYVDEDECIGCNLCALVCPVTGCITMEEIPSTAGRESWTERVAKGLA